MVPNVALITVDREKIIKKDMCILIRDNKLRLTD